MKERGQALLLLLTLLIFVGASSVFTFLSPSDGGLRQDNRTTGIMAEAKEALIGYAASSATSPGRLPCPDMNNDGVAEAPDSSGCPSGNVGRLPWRTLGLRDLRDASGERLWYAPSPVFTRNSSACCFDNDTKGDLTVYRDKATTVITSEAVAIIFAPGPALPGQLRDAGGANNPVNYLDVTDGVNNASLPAFISAQNSDRLPQSPPPSPFNDRLIVIDTANLWTAVEMRIAREMIALLSAYRAASACNCYPWAANDFDDDSVTGNENGMVPIENAAPENWSSLGITVPGYMIGVNEWGKRFFYTVAGSETASHTSGTITLDGVGKSLVVITPGPAGASRPSLNMADYIDDSENRDNGVVFITPSSTAYARDRVYTCPGTPGIC